MTWMENAAHMLNRLEDGQDGKTAYDRCNGKSATIFGVKFGEAVLWKRHCCWRCAGEDVIVGRCVLPWGPRCKAGHRCRRSGASVGRGPVLSVESVGR